MVSVSALAMTGTMLTILPNLFMNSMSMGRNLETQMVLGSVWTQQWRSQQRNTVKDCDPQSMLRLADQANALLLLILGLGLSFNSCNHFVVTIN